MKDTLSVNNNFPQNKPTQPVTDSSESENRLIKDKIMDSKKEIRLMIIGDSVIVRGGLKMLLETEGQIKFAGEAADLKEAEKQIGKVKPDILLIDASEIEGGRFNSFIETEKEHIPIIVLTSSSDTEKHQKYLMLGVDGLITKKQSAERLFEGIREVSDGGVWFDAKLMNETIKLLVCEKKAIPEKIYAYNCAVLTEREHDVLELICKGMKNKIIAENLFISETTVRHHLTSIFEKMNVSSRLELVVHAFREKLVEIPVDETEQV